MTDSKDQQSKEEERFAVALSVIVPLRPAKGEWSPPVVEDNADQVTPLVWHDWYSYIGVWDGTLKRTAPIGARGFLEKVSEDPGSAQADLPEKDLSDNPVKNPVGSRQPLIRIPGAYGYGGVSYHDYFLNHIEHFLYPGITRYRDKQEGRSRTDRLPEFKELPSRRWIGLPRKGDGVTVSLSPKSFNKILGKDQWAIDHHSGLPETLNISLDAVEVFTAYLGPSPKDFGPTTLGVFHYSLGQSTDAFEALTRLEPETQLALIATVTEVLTAPVSVETVPKDEAVLTVSFRDRAEGKLPIADSQPQQILSVPLKRKNSKWERCHEWIADFLCGEPLSRQDLAEEKVRYGKLKLRRGGSYIVYLPPSITKVSGDSETLDGPPLDPASTNGDPGDLFLSQMASLNPEPNETSTFSPSGRLRAASSWRGLVITNNKGLTDSDLRNMRSFWLQGWLIGLIQLQTLKAFAAELAIMGESYKSPKELGSLYEKWLEFRNTAWWSDLVYDSPTVEKLLRQHREIMDTERFFSELSEDFEVYVERSRQLVMSQEAERQEREAERQEAEARAKEKERDDRDRLLRNLQIFGVPLILVGAWATYREVAAYANLDEPGLVSGESVAVMAVAVGIGFVVWLILRQLDSDKEKADQVSNVDREALDDGQ